MPVVSANLIWSTLFEASAHSISFKIDTGAAANVKRKKRDDRADIKENVPAW